MAQVSFGTRQVSCKIVYYGPGLCGKTTNLEWVHRLVPSEHRGDLTSIATEGDRTLFFDFMPLDLGSVAGMKTKFQLYTVPGQVYYNATRKLVLRGADGIIFVADSAPDRLEANIESMSNLVENLTEYGIRIEEVPMVIQYNKRDLPNAVSIALLESRLNPRKVPSFEAVASRGENVLPTLKALSKLVLDRLNERYGARSLSASQVAMRVSELPVRQVSAAARAPAEAFGTVANPAPSSARTSAAAPPPPIRPRYSAKPTPTQAVITDTTSPSTRSKRSTSGARSTRDRIVLAILFAIVLIATATGTLLLFLQ